MQKIARIVFACGEVGATVRQRGGGWWCRLHSCARLVAFGLIVLGTTATSASEPVSCKLSASMVGAADYNFEGAVDLTPPGVQPPVYPKVDVRAVVRYPAKAVGSTTAVADGRFPLVLFLHGNHAICYMPELPPDERCNCFRPCPSGKRIPNVPMPFTPATTGKSPVHQQLRLPTCVRSPTEASY